MLLKKCHILKEKHVFRMYMKIACFRRSSSLWIALFFSVTIVSSSVLAGCGERRTEAELADIRHNKESRGRRRLTLAEEMKDEPRIVRKHDRAWQDEMVNSRRESRLKEALANESRKSRIQAERAVTRRNYVRQRDTL